MTPDVSTVGEQQAQQHREDHAANQSLPGLLGRDAREELVRLHQLGARHARQIGARVVDPDEEEEREDEDGAVVLPHVVHRERLGVERDERQQRHRTGDIDLSHDDERQFAQGIELVGIEAADEHQHHVDEIDDEDGRGRDVGRSQEGADEKHHAAETVDRTEDVALARHIDQREVLPKDAKGQYGKEDNKGVGTIEDGPDHQGYQQEARDGALNQTGNFHIDGGKRGVNLSERLSGFGLLLGDLALLEQLVGAGGPGAWAKDVLDILGEDDFALLERLCQAVVALLMEEEELLGTLILLGDDLGDLLVDDLGTLLAEGLGEAVFLAGGVVVADIGHGCAHAVVGHHGVGLLGDALEVVGGSAGDGSDEELLGSTSAEQSADLVAHGLVGDNLTLLGHIPRCSEGIATGYDGDLDERIAVLEEPRDGGVACLVDGDAMLLLLRHDLRLLLETADDTIDRCVEVLGIDKGLVVAGGDEGCLVADVGDVGSREAGRLARELLDVEVGCELERTEVNLEDLDAVLQLGQIDVDLTVEATGTEQRLVEDVGTVGGCQDDDTRIGAEAVHLGEQLVERRFAFVVGGCTAPRGTGSTDGVDLVDEDDAGGLLLGLAEEVAHTAGAHAHKHLDKVGTRHGEEGYVSFAGHGLGKQGLAGAGRPDEEGALGNLAAQIGELLRVLEELDNLLHLLLGFAESGNVLEGDAHLVVLLIDLRLAAADVEDAADAATATSVLAAHASEEDEPEEEDHDEGGEDVEEDVPAASGLLVAHIGLELAVLGLAPLLDVFGKLVGRRYVGLDGEFAVLGLCLLEGLLDALEALVLRALFEPGDADAGLGVDHHRAEVAFLRHAAEVGITYLARRFATSEEINAKEDADDDEVDPIEIETSAHAPATTSAWWLGAGLFGLGSGFLVYVFFVCHGSVQLTINN